MTERERHVPVLLKEAIRYLNVRPGGTYCDATLGLAGHSTAIARQIGPRGKLIGFERESLDGLLADFGVSSMQFDEAHRGFSFQAEGPLDMRMNTRKGLTAEQV